MNVSMGIDVAITTRKRLPICLLDSQGQILIAKRDEAKKWAHSAVRAIKAKLRDAEPW